MYCLVFIVLIVYQLRKFLSLAVARGFWTFVHNYNCIWVSLSTLVTFLFWRREALNAPGCDAIHIAEIETPVEFDAFLPMVDTPVFQHGTRPFPSLKTTSSKYLSLCRMFCSGFLPHKHYTIFNGKTDSFKFEVKNFPFLLKMIFLETWRVPVFEICWRGTVRWHSQGWQGWNWYPIKIWTPDAVQSTQNLPSFDN